VNPDTLAVIWILPAAFLLMLAALAVLLWRSGRSNLLQQQLLREMHERSAAEHAEKDRLAALLSESQARNLETLQVQFTSAIDTLNRQLGMVTGSLNSQLSETRGNIGRQLDGTRQVVMQVNEKLGELSEAARHMHEVGKDISSLQDILSAPKLRGNFGELLLEDLLSQVLPAGNFSLQHSFSTGEKVDAVIRLGGSLVPVDSKFPLESFSRLLTSQTETERRRCRRDFTVSIRRRIDEIASRYIRPDEGTFDFALMYIPAENVFYEVIVGDDQAPDGNGILGYALSRHVVPVSPNSFYAYLMAVAYGLKGLRIEKDARRIRGKLGELAVSLERFGEDFALGVRHLDNARSKFADGDRKLAVLSESFRGVGSDEGQDPAPGEP
jgi:DNA recombination protein RmuC